LIWAVAFGFILYVQADEWGLDPASIGLYESIMFFGVLIGSYFWSYIADRYGRMKSFKTQIFILFFGAVGMTFSYSLNMIVPFAFVIGFAIGGELALGGTVYKEFIPASYSSSICILMIGFNFGNLLTLLLAMMACDTQFPGFAGWRWMCFILLFIEAVLIVLRMKLPETPFFLASKGRMEEAEAVLTHVRPSQISLINSSETLQRSLLTANEDSFVAVPSSTQEANKTFILKLFSKDYLRATLTFGAFCFMDNIPLVGVILFMPQILAEVGSGAQSCLLSYMTSAIQQATCIPACLISYKLVDTKLGRRWSIMIFTVASGIFMFSFLLVQDFAGVRPIQIIVVSSLCISLNYMGWSGLYAMVPETYSTEVRTIASGWIAINLKVASLISPFITGALLTSAGIVPVVALFAVLMTAAGLVALAMKETRGNKTM
jgi:putative MFS transporter